MNWDVNIIDLLALITTWGLTFYVVIFLEKKQIDKRAEKDLVIAEINILVELLRALNCAIQDGERGHTSIVWRLKEIRSHFLRTTQLITTCDLSVQREIIIRNTELLKHLGTLLTYTPPNPTFQSTRAIVSIASGQITYSSSGLVEINLRCNDSVTLLHKLQVAINRA